MLHHVMFLNKKLLQTVTLGSCRN